MDGTEQVADQDVIVDEQAEQGGDEDQFFDNPEDAVDALEDDDTPEGEPAADEAEAEPEAEDDSVTVDLDGEKVSLKELKAGYYRQRDYTQKTTEVAQERKAVEASKAQLAERTSVIETALQNLSGYLQNLIPPEPPLRLAQTDPGQYQYQRALRENAIAELGQLVSIKAPVESHKQAVSEAEAREYRTRETEALVKAMPMLADPVKRAAFDQSVKSTASAFGFSEAEIAATADNRVLRLVHYAKIGMKAEENRNQAKQRVETPKAIKVKSAVPPVNVENKKAMHALSKTGSIKDAMRIDFE